VTASEFSFLALGLILGAIGGAALVELIRARPPVPREVRVTVAHDAIRRRATTLADDAFIMSGSEPARGGPADRRFVDGATPASGPERRTNVRFDGGREDLAARAVVAPSMAGAIPIRPDPSDAPVPGRIMEPSLPLSRPARVQVYDSEARSIGVPNPDPRDALREEDAARLESMPIARRIQTAIGVMDRPTPSSGAVSSDDMETPSAIRRPGKPANAGQSGVSSASSVATSPGTSAAATERCTEERRIADERCELAVRARAQADAAAHASNLAQRTYDAHEAAAVTATWDADPRAVHEAKEAAQGGFRSAVASAKTPEQHEAAARNWLNQINRINTEAREATATAAREHAAAAEIGRTLERLGLEADAARIGAENADAACLAARVAVADCDERPTTDASTFLVPPSPTSERGSRLDDDETLGIALGAGGAPRIFRLLRGDRAAMTTLVAALADDDPEERRRWQLLMPGLIEAIVADAIEASALEFPADHLFWGAFEQPQNRDIVHALSSLGYRFDGLGGWMDERYPSQRDLSLALGYAGLDPMRVRHWPNEEATIALFHDVSVSADEYLAGVAGDLTLAEMVTMLGRRADGLAEIWNHWGKIRPLLLDEV